MQVTKQEFRTVKQLAQVYATRYTAQANGALYDVNVHENGERFYTKNGLLSQKEIVHSKIERQIA